MTEAEQIAAFLAERGATRVPAGTGTLNHLSRRDWAKALRSDTRINAADNALIAQRRVATVDHLGREVVVNGLGESIAYQ